MTYQVFADNDKSYTSTRARSAASVAATWKSLGWSPKAYAVSADDNGVKTREVPVTTVKRTAAALTDAR